ncbi:hypothetical protein [Lacticaseibacillus rhamnosus]|nr:hypothetical protein [Lacticaseibacillus rhamnosus]MDK7182570.1 hypothetical protein [Lacticaseibacillus rhamnosus]MDK7238968.1 hypothetical protein [Lacticaseibacillus rhamnosus]
MKKENKQAPETNAIVFGACLFAENSQAQIWHSSGLFSEIV